LCLLYETSILQQTFAISQTLENQPTPTQVDKMADIQAEIDEIKADIKAIKANNPHWASNERIMDIINTKDKRILALETRLAPGKLPINIHIAF
jgi:hypothetical protein